MENAIREYKKITRIILQGDETIQTETPKAKIVESLNSPTTQFVTFGDITINKKIIIKIVEETVTTTVEQYVLSQSRLVRDEIYKRKKRLEENLQSGLESFRTIEGVSNRIRNKNLA